MRSLNSVNKLPNYANGLEIPHRKPILQPHQHLPRLQHPWHLMVASHPTTSSTLNLIYVPFLTVQSPILTLLLHLQPHFHPFHYEDQKDTIPTCQFLPILRLHVQSKHLVPLHPDPCPFLLPHPILTTLMLGFALPNDQELPPWSSLSIAMASFQKNRLQLLHALRRSLILNLKLIHSSSTTTMWILTPRIPIILLPKPHLRHRPIQCDPALLHQFPSAPANLDPAIVDHRNRPWPPCDDRELAQYKMDTKSRPSWKTIAKRMNRTVDSCQARWQWLKNTHPELLHPGNATEAGDDGD